MAEDQSKELKVLCERPLVVHLGEEEVEVFPPTLAKLEAAAEPYARLIEKAEALIGPKESAKKKKVAARAVIKQVFEDTHKFLGELLPIVKIYLAPRGKIDSKFTLEELKRGLDVVDLQRIFGFVQDSISAGDLMGKALAPLAPISPEVTKPVGLKS